MLQTGVLSASFQPAGPPPLTSSPEDAQSLPLRPAPSDSSWAPGLGSQALASSHPRSSKTENGNSFFSLGCGLRPTAAFPRECIQCLLKKYPVYSWRRNVPNAGWRFNPWRGPGLLHGTAGGDPRVSEGRGLGRWPCAPSAPAPDPAVLRPPSSRPSCPWTFPASLVPFLQASWLLNIAVIA